MPMMGWRIYSRKGNLHAGVVLGDFGKEVAAGRHRNGSLELGGELSRGAEALISKR